MKKGLSPIITSVIYIGIVLSGITLVVTTGMPALQKMQDASAIDQARGAFSNLNQIVQEVSSEGEGSQRKVSLSLSGGKLHLDDDKLFWSIETGADIIDPRTKITRNNVFLACSANTDVYKETLDGKDYWVLENSYLKVWIRDFGSSNNRVSINTTNLVYKIYNKKEGFNLTDYSLNMKIDDEISSSGGKGYTTAETGTDLGSGKVEAYFYNTDIGMDYKLEFVLESSADFLTLNTEVL